MIEYFKYTISREPFKAQQMTALHWECYEAVKTDELTKKLEEAQDDPFRLVCLVKCLAELESVGLLNPAGKRYKYSEWKKNFDKTQSASTTEEVEKKAQKKSAPTKKVGSIEVPQEVVALERVEVKPKAKGSQNKVASEAAPSEEKSETTSNVNSPDQVSDLQEEVIDVKEVQKKSRGKSVSLDL